MARAVWRGVYEAVARCRTRRLCPTGNRASEALEDDGVSVVFAARLGGAIRHGMNIWVARFLGTHFPWHTFSINILGSTAMGAGHRLFAGRGIGAEGHMRCSYHRDPGRAHDLFGLFARRHARGSA